MSAPVSISAAAGMSLRRAVHVQARGGIGEQSAAQRQPQEQEPRARPPIGERGEEALHAGELTHEHGALNEPS